MYRLIVKLFIVDAMPYINDLMSVDKCGEIIMCFVRSTFVITDGSNASCTSPGFKTYKTRIVRCHNRAFSRKIVRKHNMSDANNEDID